MNAPLFLRVSAIMCLLCASAHGQSYTFTTLAGPVTVRGSVDGAGSDARFNTPTCVAADASGNLYVGDTVNYTVRKITPAGVVTTLAGLAGTRGTTDGAGTGARFSSIYGITVGPSGDVFVSDYDNHTIRRVTPAGVVTTFAGAPGQSGTSDGTGGAARFRNPVGLAFDADGNLFVVDRGNRTIRKITSAAVVSTFAGLAGVGGTADGAGTNARFNALSSLTMDAAGTLYVTDSSNANVRKISPAGDVTTLAGLAGSTGSTNGTGTGALFYLPNGIAVDGSGNVFVADTGNETIRRITAAGAVTTFAGSTSGIGNADGTGSSAKFFRPYGLCTDSRGNLYVADAENESVRKITSAGVVTTVAGSGGSFGAVDGTGTAARFNFPAAIALDHTGNVFVTDSVNATVRKISPAGVTTIFAGASGIPPGSATSLDGVGTEARFVFPFGLGVDAADNLYVVDTIYGVIRRITPGAAVTTIAGQGAFATGSADGTGSAARFNSPRGAATDRDGNTYVADYTNHTIRKVTPAGVVTTLAGLAGVPGNANGFSSAARFTGPTGVAVDTDGNVYVAEYGANTIRKITTDGIVSTLAGLAGFTGSADGVGSAARFYGPTGLAVDRAGNVFVADSNNSLIRKITPGGSVTTVGGQLPAGPSESADGPGATARFSSPTSVALDASEALYVVDSLNNRIVKGVLDTMPAIAVQPLSLNVTPGSRVALTVSASGGGLGYQWYFNGAPISGATASTLSLPSVQSVNSGNYTVTVSNSAGARVSSTAALSVATSSDPGRLINLSILTPLAAGETLTMGTALGPPGTIGPKALVARAAGPALGAFGVTTFLPDPKLSLVSITTGKTIATNDNWQGDSALSAAFTQVGAFPYGSANSSDAGLALSNFAPGNYTAQITDAGTGAGSVIAELYDATPASAFTSATPRLINVSVLKQIGTGTTLTVGFVIGGATAKTVLVRAVGPSLAAAPFNIATAMADPQLELFNNSTGAKINENNDWGGGTTLSAAFSSVGAFAFASGATKDAALLITLPPGQYSARVSGADAGGGTALVEVYEVP